MSQTKRSLLGLLSFSLLSAVAVAAPLVKVKALKPVAAGVGRLFAESPDVVRVVVKDERPPDPILIAGFVERPPWSPAMIAHYTEKPGASTELFEAGAREAVEVLGLKPGDGGNVLELTVKDFRVEFASHVFGGFNMIAYGNLQASLKGADGAELASKSFRYASWDSTQRPSIESVYQRAAWEAAAKTLLAHFPKKPEPEAIRRVVSSLDTVKEDAPRAYAIYWLGLTGSEDPAVAEKLFALFRQAEDQTIYENSAIALARLGAAGAREEIEAVLSGSKKLKEWDPREDAEEAWTLLHALAILGATDLPAKAPPTVQRHKERLAELAQFHATGEVPKMSAKLEQELGKARKKKGI